MNKTILRDIVIVFLVLVLVLLNVIIPLVKKQQSTAYHVDIIKLGQSYKTAQSDREKLDIMSKVITLLNPLTFSFFEISNTKAMLCRDGKGGGRGSTCGCADWIYHNFGAGVSTADYWDLMGMCTGS